MRARSNRTHYMGTSNRVIDNDKNKSLSILQRSFNKSLMLNEKQKSTFIQSSNKSQNLLQATNKMVLQRSATLRENPFNGTNTQLQSKRFDKMNIRRPESKQIQPKILPKLIDKSCYLNQNVKQIKREFKQCNISMHKINLIKQTFIKNNKDRTNLKQYFLQYANNQQKIGKDQLKKIIRNYGYDISEDQIKLIIALNHAQCQKNQNNKQQLGILQFVNLMTKQNIYFKTLNIQHQEKNTKIFIDRHFQILRNKFNNLKQAFKIYRQRGEQIDYDKFTYTMKKLDITDLIMPKKQRDQLFNQFYDSKSKEFNAEKLLSAIAVQQHAEKKNQSQKNQFQQNLKYIEQKQYQKNEKKIIKFDLKRSSSFEYENHINAINKILQKIRVCNKQKDFIKRIYKQNNEITINQLKNKLEQVLQKEGYNYSKSDYDSLISYFDYDKDFKIDKNSLQNFLLKQTSKQAMDRCQRRVRNIRPINKPGNQYFDQKQALTSLQRLKQIKMNPETSKFFTELDIDKDGYISKDQFKNQLQNIPFFNKQKQQTQNLVNFFFQSTSSLNRKQFIQKFNAELVSIEPFRSKSVSQWTHLKRSVISENNNFKYQNPTKFSAWPSYLNDSNLSLIQAPKNAGTFINQNQRFNVSQKHDFGQRQKLQKAKIYNKKIAKIAAWNNRYQNQLKQRVLAQQKKMLQKNYGIRIIQEQYLQKVKEEK